MPESFEEYLANGATLPEVLAINPRGKFPALEDRSTGLVLAESAAINTYLGDKYGDGSIVPRASRRIAFLPSVASARHVCESPALPRGPSVCAAHVRFQKLPKSVQRAPFPPTHTSAKSPRP